jgi:hypothetical protein
MVLSEGMTLTDRVVVATFLNPITNKRNRSRRAKEANGTTREGKCGKKGNDGRGKLIEEGK